MSGKAGSDQTVHNGSDNSHVLLSLSDRLGSASAIIDRDTGELVERIAYTAYGQTDSDYRPARWKSYREPYRYTGKEDEIETGLTYFGSRYYSAPLNRWISPDPLTVHGLGSDLNPYAFVGGAPLGRTDPLGLDGTEQGSDSSQQDTNGCDACSTPSGQARPIDWGKTGQWFENAGKNIGKAFGDAGNWLSDEWKGIGGHGDPVAPPPLTIATTGGVSAAQQQNNQDKAAVMAIGHVVLKRFSMT